MNKSGNSTMIVLVRLALLGGTLAFAPIVQAQIDFSGLASRLDGSTRKYSLDDLFQDGAVVKDVSGRKDEFSRKISMKIYTKRLPDDTIVNDIGIFDITDTNDIYGQRFPINSNNQAFMLDDRTEGHKRYELKFGRADKKGDRTVTFTRPDGGQSIETSVFDLFLKRADQAAAMGMFVEIGGEEFYVLPQGGEKGVLAFFPKAVIDGRRTGDPRDLSPALYAEVSQRGYDGRSQNVRPGRRGGPHLGEVGGKDYHLEFNKKLGAWEVKEGSGD